MEQTDYLTLTGTPHDRWAHFESLVRTHQRALYHFALRLTGNEQDAEDLLQESLLRAYRSFERFSPGTAFDRWVYRIVYHLFVDGYRHRKRAQIHLASLDEPIAAEDSEIQREIPDQRNNPEDLALTQEFHREVKSALANLPVDFRTAVVLCDIQGLSYEEISQIMNCSIGTVRSRIHRGRRLLRDRLRPYLAEVRKEVGRS
ncbi:MAG: sigma-70 family RNA polymerase sigma factor [Bacteroidota bacterium]